MSAGQFDHTTDVLVVGSGAGGMVAALTAQLAGADTLLIEKAPWYGGSSALSGGGIWIPNNPTLRRSGVEDPADSVVDYLRTLTDGLVSAERLAAYVHQGPAMMAALESMSADLRFYYVAGYCDYHPEVAGGRADGRSVEALPFDLNRLGPDAKDLRRAAISAPGGMYLTQADYAQVAMLRRTWAGKLRAVRVALRFAVHRLRGRRMSALGQSLVGRLRLAMQQAGIPLWLEAPLRELIVEDGVVTGAVVERAGTLIRVRARAGVILASGGFEHNQEKRDRYLPAPGRAIASGGASSNTGDGIECGVAAGAAVALMDRAWWMPVIVPPQKSAQVLVSERCIPGSVIVAPDGRRFSNESSPYVNFVRAQIETGHREVFHVMDARARARYPYAGILPGQPFPKSWYASGLVARADSVDALADAVGIPREALAATIEEFNGFARAGTDLGYGRGDSAYDRYYGDPTLPNPNLDVIGKAPFYAIRITAGDIGTKGGLVTDEHGRVLDEQSRPVPGLYATGNTSASVMGDEYPGPGATIGASMVFGWVSAQHLAEQLR